jgi:hypothetical protein
MDLTDGSETSANIKQTLGKGLKPLKMDLTEGSETSANIKQTLGKHPKVNTVNCSESLGIGVFTAPEERGIPHPPLC